LPCHLGEVAPQLWQTNWDLARAIVTVYFLTCILIGPSARPCTN